MSTYGISWIKLNQAGTEVDEVKIHKFSKAESAAEYEIDDGTAMAYHEVASLIDSGDKVWVIVYDGPGKFRHTDKVRVKPGQYEYLESFGADGAATTALMSLPT